LSPTADRRDTHRQTVSPRPRGQTFLERSSPRPPKEWLHRPQYSNRVSPPETPEVPHTGEPNSLAPSAPSHSVRQRSLSLEVQNRVAPHCQPPPGNPAACPLCPAHEPTTRKLAQRRTANAERA